MTVSGSDTQSVGIRVRLLRPEDVRRFKLWGHHADLRFRCYDFPDLGARNGGNTLNQVVWFYKRNIPFLRWVYAIEDGSGTLVGYFKVVKKRLFEKRAELSMVLDPNSVGKRYGSEAFIPLLRVCFEELKLSEVWVSVVDFNQPSLRLLENAGFEKYTKAEEPYDDQENWKELLEAFPDNFFVANKKLMCRLNYLKLNRTQYQKLQSKGPGDV